MSLILECAALIPRVSNKVANGFVNVLHKLPIRVLSLEPATLSRGYCKQSFCGHPQPRMSRKQFFRSIVAFFSVKHQRTVWNLRLWQPRGEAHLGGSTPQVSWNKVYAHDNWRGLTLPTYTANVPFPMPCLCIQAEVGVI